MTLLEAIMLGILQGATEFLPISSSGHLVLGEHALGLQEPQLLFDITLHVGTLVSVMAFYWRDLLMIAAGLWRGLLDGARQRSLRALLAPQGMRLAMLVLLATLPTGLIGLLLKDLLEPTDGQRAISAAMVCGLLLLNGLILKANAVFATRQPDASDQPSRDGALALWNMTPLIALLIGVAQGVAVLPGISRSGMTITCALALGVERMHAARYSFLLSIPAILGALVLKLDPAAFATSQGQGSALPMFLAGAAAAGLVGYGCLVLLTHLLRRAQFHHFAWYCWAVGGAGLLYFATR